MVEFSYNNSYHSSIGMPPYQALYGRPCRTPLSWGNPKDKLMLGPDMLKEMEDMVKKVHSNLRVS